MVTHILVIKDISKQNTDVHASLCSELICNDINDTSITR